MNEQQIFIVLRKQPVAGAPASMNQPSPAQPADVTKVTNFCSVYQILQAVVCPCQCVVYLASIHYLRILFVSQVHNQLC